MLTKDRNKLITTLAEQGLDLPHEMRLLPIYGHRYLACTANPGSSAVLSIDGSDDAVVYGNSLKEYLEENFSETRLRGTTRRSHE